jgi:hypothetical protein
MDCRTRIPVAFASASSRRRFSCSALKLASAFDVCFFGWCTVPQLAFVDAVRHDGLGSVLARFELGHFAFSGVSGFSSLISTYLLRGIAFSPSGCCLYAVPIWTSSGLAATLAFTCASSLAA